MSAKAIMIQGTMSNSGKTFVTAGLCRVLRQDGYRTAPFKSQNMALNSYITKDGLEIGRAQAMQAEAAMIEPHVNMNPVLLKPTSTMGSQVVVNGEVYGSFQAFDYYKEKKHLKPIIQKSYDDLAKDYDVIVLEGAGSPAEINLKQDDIVNMGMAAMADADVLLVADIDRGGVFASIYGTVELLSQEEKARIKGIIINKFRGDVKVLAPGLKMIEDLVQIPVVGVIPMEDIDIDDEDSLSSRLEQKKAGAFVDVAVIRFPHISNFTDFSIFDLIEGVQIRYVSSKDELKNPDLIILPGTKNTMADLIWLRTTGLESAVIRLARTTRVIGICGGFQMLGKTLKDPMSVEHGGEMKGIGLLDTETIFQESKTRTQIQGRIIEERNFYGLKTEELSVSGYEIHMGTTINLGLAKPMIQLADGRTDGYCDESGLVWGTYLHGIFDNETLVYGLVQTIMAEKGIEFSDDKLDLHAYKEEQYDKLADLIRRSVDMDFIRSLLSDELYEMAHQTFENGCIHIYCGDGKGKTTTAMGLSIRAAGAGKKVLLYQFMKNNTSSEIKSLKKIANITRVQGDDQVKFSFQMTEEEKQIERARNNQKLKDLIRQTEDFDMLVLDEIIYTIAAGLLDEDQLINFLTNKPDRLEVVMTGQNPSERIIACADYVSEIKKIKHPYDKGTKSRIGIEK